MCLHVVGNKVNLAIKLQVTLLQSHIKLTLVNTFASGSLSSLKHLFRTNWHSQQDPKSVFVIRMNLTFAFKTIKIYFKAESKTSHIYFQIFNAFQNFKLIFLSVTPGKS